MTIHKEGRTTLLLGALFCVALSSLSYLYVSSTSAKCAIYTFCTLLFLTLLQFFRKPKRGCVVDNNTIVSPADGKIVAIEEVQETEYFNDKRIQISIFMSPFNVHINWFPINGIVNYVKYHPGLFLVAWHPKSSTDNERTTLVVENENKQEVLFRQIAGALARRIVFYPKVKETVKAGSEFGFIKFGSRVDVLLPTSAKVQVELNQKVKGTETILAKFS